MNRTKICKICGKRKRINQFAKQAATKDGLRPWCRKCCREYAEKYYQINKNKLLSRANKRYQTNKGKQNG